MSSQKVTAANINSTNSMGIQNNNVVSSSSVVHARVGSVEGLHGKKINLLTPGEHSSIQSRNNNPSLQQNGSSGAGDYTSQPDLQQPGTPTAAGKSYSLKVPPMKLTADQ